MNRRTRAAIIALCILFIGSSCKKSSPQSYPVRTIQFVLYTNVDFSGDNNIIHFTLHMRNHNKVLFDSALAPMKISEIPKAANQIVIERTVPDNDPSDLSVGFLYAIDNVGNSWHLDTCAAGLTFKKVEFPFQ